MSLNTFFKSRFVLRRSFLITQKKHFLKISWFFLENILWNIFLLFFVIKSWSILIFLYPGCILKYKLNLWCGGKSKNYLKFRHFRSIGSWKYFLKINAIYIKEVLENIVLKNSTNLVRSSFKNILKISNLSTTLLKLTDRNAQLMVRGSFKIYYIKNLRFFVRKFLQNNFQKYERNSKKILKKSRSLKKSFWTKPFIKNHNLGQKVFLCFVSRN